MIYTIYKITLPNGRIYIGKTSKGIEERLADHIKRGKTTFSAILRTFHVEQIKIEALCQTHHWAQAKGWEIAQIKKHDALNPAIGLNKTRGGFYDKIDSKKRNFQGYSRA